jgi:signal transduction histidine kinase
MFDKLKPKIFTKLFLTYLVITFASIVFSGVLFYVLFQNDLKQHYLDSMLKEQKRIEQLIHQAYLNDGSEESITATLKLWMEGDNRSIYAFDEYGQLLYEVSSNNEVITIDPAIVVNVLGGAEILQHYKLDGRHIFMTASPIEETMVTQEKALVLIQHGFDRGANEVKYQFLITFGITILFTALCLFFVSKKITAPLREMSHVAMEYAKGKFDYKVNVKSDDEIGQLGRTINHMAKELESLDQMRKEFIANVSHDLRSPLTSINGFVGAMLDGTIPRERQNHYLTIMKDEAERSIKLVNDLLDIARIESRQMEIHPIKYNLSEQIRKVLAKLEPDLIKHQITPNLLIKEEEEIKVYADPDRIEQVLFNLIQNAIQHSLQKGNLDISIEERENVTITIHDYGVGIKGEDLKYIWERFYKGDKARSKKVGTGIGLSIVKHILDLHGTTIKVESILGKGTIFTFMLPKEETSNR